LHGGAVGARVAAILDGANRDAAAVAEQAEADARECLGAAHGEARDAFRAAADAAREVARERATTLSEMRRSIAERCESLIAEADDPDHVRDQIESLLVALAETEALLTAGGGAEREPAVPDGLAVERTADRGPRTAGPEPEPAAPAEEPFVAAEPAPEAESATSAVRGPRSATPFKHWHSGRHDGQVLALLRLAVAGMTRDQLEHELDPALPEDEREAVLDDVFGAPEKARQRADGNGSRRVTAASEPA
jgi:hypothetical protein